VAEAKLRGCSSLTLNAVELTSGSEDDYFESRTKFYTVYEYAMGGDLFEHVVSCGKLSEVEAQAVIRSLLVSPVIVASGCRSLTALRADRTVFCSSIQGPSFTEASAPTVLKLDILFDP
jgi:serine/threonine protein kinase